MQKCLAGRGDQKLAVRSTRISGLSYIELWKTEASGTASLGV